MSWEEREAEIRQRVSTCDLVPAQDAGDLLTEIVRLRALVNRERARLRYVADRDAIAASLVAEARDVIGDRP